MLSTIQGIQYKSILHAQPLEGRTLSAIVDTSDMTGVGTLVYEMGCEMSTSSASSDNSASSASSDLSETSVSSMTVSSASTDLSESSASSSDSLSLTSVSSAIRLTILLVLQPLLALLRPMKVTLPQAV